MVRLLNVKLLKAGFLYLQYVTIQATVVAFKKITEMSVSDLAHQLLPILMCPMNCDNGIMKDPVVLAACQHSFCKNCIYIWVKTRHRTCPICRSQIREHFEDVHAYASGLLAEPNKTLQTICELVRSMTTPLEFPQVNDKQPDSETEEETKLAPGKVEPTIKISHGTYSHSG